MVKPTGEDKQMIVAIMIKQPYKSIVIPTYWDSTFEAFETYIWRHLQGQTPIWFQFEETKTLIILPKGVPIVVLSEIQTLEFMNQDKLRNELHSSLAEKLFGEPDESQN